MKSSLYIILLGITIMNVVLVKKFWGKTTEKPATKHMAFIYRKELLYRPS